MSKFAVEDIRNVAFVGHGAVGKTTLIEALLFHAKAIDRKGSVDDGSSILDFDEEEKASRHSIDSHLSHCDWKGKRLNLVDTAGYPDFAGETVAAIHNVETVAVVLDAHKGIEVNTRKMFEEAGRAGVARFLVFDKLDAENVHLAELLGRVKETFGKECTLLQAPIGIGSEYHGIFDLLTPPIDVAANASVDVEALHEELIEKLVETDDDLLTRFLDGELPSTEKLVELMVHAVVHGQIIPILCTSGKHEEGLSEFLDALVLYAPSPKIGVERHATENGIDFVLEPNGSKPFVGRAFKTLSDKFGNITYIRVFQGTATSNGSYKCHRDGSAYRLATINAVMGRTLEKVDSAGPGEFIGVTKIDNVEINDVLSDAGNIAMNPVAFPKPMFPLAISAKSRADDVKVLSSLRKIVHEDPSFEFHRDEQTGETIMTGLSQLHLETVQHRLKQREHLELITHEPKVPFKETISKVGEGMFRHKKQTGGRGQFAEVHLRLHPRERGSGFEFMDSIVGGVIPGQYIPAVEKGIREVMTHGVIAGCQVVDLAAEVYFGKYHDVDSSEQAFKYAASMAFREAFQKCAPQLLEPIVSIEVTAPIESMGDINGDLNGRRAQITGMDVLAGGLQVVKANVPLAEVLRYQTELKSMTGGQGSFSMEFSHLAPAPPHIQQQVTAKHQSNKTEHAEH